MKLDIKKSMIGLVILLMIGTVNASNGNGGGGDEKSFSDVKENLEQAIEQRNFHDAKEYLNELFPIMKSEIKKSKKTLAELEKADNPELDPVEFAKGLERKKELYEHLKSLVNISPAAMRAKANDLMAMIKEFDELVIVA